MTQIYDNALYESVESALSLMDCDIDPAECHGILCGMLSGNRAFNPTIWLNHATGYERELDFDDLGHGHVFGELVAKTIEGFESDDFSLDLLLPVEEESVDARTQGLASWCRGFLSGFGFTELSDLEDLSEDSRGYLRDLQQIGRAESTNASDEGDEFALMELCEYARMGALLLREEVHIAASDMPAADNETLH